MMSEITSKLESLGLTDKEARAYAALLTMKKGSVLDVATKAGLKRPTTYSVLDSLEEKGLVSSTLFRHVRDYRALDPQHLKAFVAKQTHLVKANLPVMAKLYEHRKFKLRLRVYEGISAVKTLFEKSLREGNPMHILGQEEKLSKYLGEYWQYYLKRSRQKAMAPKIKNLDHQITLLVWTDKVAFIDFSQPIQSFAFRNRELHQVYQDLWTNY